MLLPELREADQAIFWAINSNTPIIGQAPSWKPTVNNLRPLFEAAAKHTGCVIQRAEKDGTQYHVTLEPTQPIDINVTIHTSLSRDTRMDTFVDFANTSFRTDLKALFGDVRNPTLWNTDAARKWSMDLARYAAAIFEWWAVAAK